MKLLLRAITIVLLSTFCIQTISPLESSQQAVRASKRDWRKITVTITGNDGSQVSKTTFRRNTDRLGGKLRGKSGSLWFDWRKAPNTITAYYNDEPDKKFSRPVSQEEAEGSEIVISGEKIEMGKVGSKKNVPTSKSEATTNARVTIELGREVLVVSGTIDLTQSIAENSGPGRTHPLGSPVLEKGVYLRSGTILINTGKDTKIYVKGDDLVGVPSQITTLKKEQVAKALKRADTSPITIVIHDDYSAELL